jgi:pimeloyl-ACP methyl ester carboxylesterase
MVCIFLGSAFCKPPHTNSPQKQPKQTTKRNIARYETTAIYTHPEAKVDIVLVHGLNGSPEGTWTSPDGTYWPADLLPASLRGLQANILVYGYNADVYSRRNDRSASDNFIHQHAQTLVTSLTLYRRSEGIYKNPIIWVCHSLGGILVKRALLYSNDLRTAHHEHYRSIYVSTYGLMFLGTPHTGSDAATWGLMLQGMSDVVVPKKFFESESILLKTLKKDNETLANINNHFLDIYQRFRIHMVHENHKTDIKGTK